MSFTWDQDDRGEDYPDTYIRTDMVVLDAEHYPDNLRRATLCEIEESDGDSTTDDCTDPYGATWRSSYYNNQSGKIYEKKDFGDKTSTWNRRAMSLATVQKFLRSWQGYRMTGDLNIWWNGDRCENDDGDAWPCNWDANWFTMTYDGYRRWTTGPHEAGHAYHRQLYEQDEDGSGTGNAENDETGTDGRNLRDFHHNSSSISAGMYDDTWDAMKKNEVDCQVW